MSRFIGGRRGMVFLAGMSLALLPGAASPPAAPSDPASGPGGPDLTPLNEAIMALYQTDVFRSEATLQIRGAAGGRSLRLRERLRVTIKRPDAFMSDVTLLRPNDAPGPRYRVVCDGDRVWLYQPGLRRYAVTSRREFMKGNCLLPAVGLLDGLFALSAVPSGDPSVSLGADVARGRQTVLGTDYTVYTVNPGRHGLRLRLFLDPQRPLVRRLEMTGGTPGTSSTVWEKVTRQSSEGFSPTFSIRFVPPPGCRRVGDVAIGPFHQTGNDRQPTRAGRDAARIQHGQAPIPEVERMPSLPRPFHMRDWRATARAFDRLAFDPARTGPYLPLLWWDDSRANFPWRTFGLPSYVGDARQRGPGGAGSAQEAVACLAAVLGATLAGVDKSRGPHDWVRMAQQFYNRADGQGVVLNHTRDRSGSSFWYDLWPAVLFDGLADRYRRVPGTAAVMRGTADRWRDACARLAGPDGVPDFGHTAFGLAAMRPVDNGRWTEPDGAAGAGWLEYMAWARWRDPRYLAAADGCLRFLQRQAANPFYEVLLPYGAYLAARADAERGRTYDDGRLLRWCFAKKAIVGNWGGYACDGLMGAPDYQGGYAFAMNTFATAGALVPLVRYDARYARAVGRWMLNAANAAGLFYPDGLPAENQSGPRWAGDPEGAVAYEGLRREWEGKSPCATGDAVRGGWAPTDLGVYGSAYAGFFGGIISRTGDPAILRLDCLATDFFHGPAYPTYLCYNPYGAPKRVSVPVGPGRRDLYDAAAHRFLARGVAGRTAFVLPADSAAVVVVAQAGSPQRRIGNRLLLGGVVADYAAAPAGDGARHQTNRAH